MPTPEAQNPYTFPNEAIPYTLDDVSSYLDTQLETENGQFEYYAGDLGEWDFRAMEAPPTRDTKKVADFWDMVGIAKDTFDASLAQGVSVIGEELHLQSVESFGAEMAKRNLRAAQRHGMPSVDSIMDVEDFSSATDFVTYAVASAIPSISISAGTALTGTGIGAGVGGPAGALVGGFLGAFVPSALAGTGEVAREIEERGGGSESNLLALSAGAAIGALDAVAIGKVLGPIMPAVRRLFTDKVVKAELLKMGLKQEAIKGLFRGAIVEGSQESAQEAIVLATAGLATGQEISGEEFKERMANAAIMGAIAGGSLGSIGSAGGAWLNNQTVQEELSAQARLDDYMGNMIARRLPEGGVNGWSMEKLMLQMSDSMLSDSSEYLPGGGAFYDVNTGQLKEGSIERLRSPLVDRSAYGAGKKFLEIFGYKSVSMLKPLSEGNVYAEELMTNHHIDNPHHTGKFTMMEKSEVLNGIWDAELFVHLAKIKDPKEQAQLVDVLRDRGSLAAAWNSAAGTPLGEASEGIGQLMQAVWERAKKAGIDAGFLNNFYPRVWDVKRMKQTPGMRERFIQVVSAQYIARSQQAHPERETATQQEVLDPFSDIAKVKNAKKKPVLDPDKPAVMSQSRAEQIAADIFQRITRGDGVLINNAGLNKTPDGRRIVQVNVDGELVERRLPEGNLMEGDKDTPRVLRGEGRPKHSSLEKPRELAFIPDEILKEFLKNDPIKVLHSYLESASKAIVYAETNGPKEEMLNETIRKMVEEGQKRGRLVTQDEIDRIYALNDAFLGMYKPIAHGGLSLVNNVLLTYQYIRLLPMATLASIQEFFPMFIHGSSLGFKGLGRAIRHSFRNNFGKVMKDFKGDDLDAALSHIRVASDHATAERLAAIYGGDVADINDRFFKLIGLHQWTKFTRTAAWATGVEMIKHHGQALLDEQGGEAKYKPSTLERYRKELNELGLEEWEVMQWVGEGSPVKTEYFDRGVRLGAFRFTNEVVMLPRYSVRPMWHNNPHFQLLSQLKGFQTVFGNTVMKKWLQTLIQGQTTEKVRIALMATMMMIFAAGMNEIRELIQYGVEGNPSFEDETDSEWAARVLQRVGFLGSTQFLVDSFNAVTFGASVMDPVLGPTFSQVSSGTTALFGAMRGSPERLGTEVLKAIPGLSVTPALREAIKEAIQ